MLPDTIQPTELLWTLIAIPGALFWVVNLQSALAARRAAKLLEYTPSVQLYCNFSVESTAIMVTIEVIFVILGVLAMLSPNNPDSPFLVKYVFSAMLILASMAISYKAFRWRKVDVAVRRAMRTEVEG